MISKRNHSLALALALASLGVSTVAQPRIMNKVGAPDLQDEHWYCIRDAGEGEQKSIEVFIYGEIGYWGITSGDFIRDLKAKDDGVSPVVVAFDTIGGDLFDGIAIHNTLNALGERCTARIDGACWSAGSVAASGAHRVLMADNALFMIHNPWTFAAGDSEELRKMADMMDKAFEGIVTSYQRRPLAIDEAELRRLINEETWLTASEAQEMGFVDEVLSGSQPQVSNHANGKILNRYRNIPQSARDLMARANPAPQNTPEPPEADLPAEPDASTLAADLLARCAGAGISAYAEGLIKASGLKSRAAVDAEFNRAKAVHDLCVLAKRPGDAADLISSGVDAEGARAKLFDKLVASSSQVELDNIPPVDQPPSNGPQAKAVNPGAIYASRKSQASKGERK